MLISILAALALVFADAPAAAPPPAPTPAATPAPTPAAPPAPAKPVVDPVTVEINALLEPYKGKTGDRLRGLLGFSNGTRIAVDGEVVFWIISVPPEMVCGMGAGGGAMRCVRGDPAECRLAIAFDPEKLVRTWAVTGVPRICQDFVGKLKAG